MSAEMERRLTLQGRQQELLLELVRRALQRLTSAEADIAAAQSQINQQAFQLAGHDAQFDAQAIRMDAFGDALAQMEMLRLRLTGRLGELERAATGGRDDGTA